MGAFEEWKSLYTKEVDKVWNSERLELRKSAMIICVLKQEFQRVEEGLSNQLVKYKQQLKSVEDSKAFANHSLFDTTEIQPRANEEINRSPKINRNRNISRIKRSLNGSLLNCSKENNVPKVKLLDSNLDDSTFLASQELEPSLNFLLPNKMKTPEFKTPLKPPIIADVVDSSFLIEDSPVESFLKKPKKRSFQKFRKNPKTCTLTQLFNSLPSDRPSGCSKSCTKDKLVISSDDDTFIEVEKPKKTFKTDKKPTFQGYDEFPKAKSKSPQYVHKTDPVRRKADRLKLPGWSCNECKHFYESLNLPTEELKEKMDICSRHRNKFQPMDETIKGYWDAGMPPTQEDDY